MTTELLTTEQLADRLKVSRITIVRWRKKGLPTKKINGYSVRFDIAEVMQWINKQNN
jgi:excisionase family DNA binding protein